MGLGPRLQTVHQPCAVASTPSFLTEIIDSLFALLFPTPCSLCGGELTGASMVGICRTCWAGLSPWTGATCEQCGEPLASDVASPTTPEAGELLCGACRRGDHKFDRAASYGLYRGDLRAVILQLKFGHRERLGERLGALLVPVWLRVVPPEMVASEPPLIMPIPLHPSRQRERGFDQAQLVASGLVRALRRDPETRALRVATHCLRRTRATAPQSGLSLVARRENVRGVFAVTEPKRVRDRVVVLVDDVMTTGATLSACAASLKGAGARRVLALTLARATPEFPDLL
ncbi:MAG TPA: ComF family protein [Terriglobia bacterium]|nr:ComF family protein [Terriglobia bacterium]